MVTGGFDGFIRTWSSDGKLVDSVSAADSVQALCYVRPSGHLWFAGALMTATGILMRAPSLSLTVGRR